MDRRGERTLGAWAAARWTLAVLGTLFAGAGLSAFIPFGKAFVVPMFIVAPTIVFEFDSVLPSSSDSVSYAQSTTVLAGWILVGLLCLAGSLGLDRRRETVPVTVRLASLALLPWGGLSSVVGLALFYTPGPVRPEGQPRTAVAAAIGVILALSWPVWVKLMVGGGYGDLVRHPVPTVMVPLVVALAGALVTVLAARPRGAGAAARTPHEATR